MRAFQAAFLIATLGWVAFLPSFPDEVYPRKETAMRKGANGGHTFRLRIVVGPFRAKQHKVIKGDDRPLTKDGHGKETLVDNREAWGTDGGVPQGEIYSLELWIGESQIKVPSRLYSDCFWPNVDEESLMAWIDRKGRYVCIKMCGSDGAGTYSVIWWIHADGRTRRKIWSPVI